MCYARIPYVLHRNTVCVICDYVNTICGTVNTICGIVKTICGTVNTICGSVNTVCFTCVCGYSALRITFVHRI